jgi:membrane-bound lytic murein transglycosylase MltF
MHRRSIYDFHLKKKSYGITKTKVSNQLAAKNGSLISTSLVSLTNSEIIFAEGGNEILKKKKKG